MGSRPQTFLSKFVGEEGEGVDTSLEIFKLLWHFLEAKFIFMYKARSCHVRYLLKEPVAKESVYWNDFTAVPDLGGYRSSP